MKSYYTYANHIISIDLPQEVQLFSLKQHLPGISKTSEKKSDISIDFKDSLDSHIIFDLHHLRIYDIFNSSWLSDLPHLIYSYLKYVFFHKNMYFVHSCMIKNTIFVGHSGSGKTSLCIEALHKNLPLQSCDRTVVCFKNNGLKFIRGTDILSVRQEQEQPKLELINTHYDRNIYSVDTSCQQNIEKIKLFHISPQKTEKNIEGLSVVHQLYSFFIDNIKSDCFVQNGKLLFAPVYSQTHKKILFENLKNMKLPVSFISGNLNDILQNS